MVITYHGGYFVRISHGDTVIGINPFSKKSSMKPIHFGARIALVSMNHPDMNGAEQLEHGDKVPFVIAGPGEYEIGGITINGFASPKPVGKEERINTIYTIELEGMRICYLGALSSAELGSELIEGIGSVDILFAPVAGGDVISALDAEKLAVSLDASLIIPLAWDSPSDKNLKTFLKESGAEGQKPVDRLTLKKKDLEGKEGEVVLLEIQNHA